MYNTGNPIGSTAPKDFSDNSEITDRYVNDVVNETTLDRFGRSRLTIHGQQENARRSLENIEYVASGVIANLGFFPPVDYTTGLNVDSQNFTTTYNGIVYAAQPAAVPFTTAAWDAAQWYPIQNVLNQKNLLVFNTYAEASAAAATLPDGQRLEVESDAMRDGNRTRYFVQGGLIVFAGNVDQLRIDLTDYSGSIPTSPKWVDVPKRVISSLDTSDIALAARTDYLKNVSPLSLEQFIPHGFNTETQDCSAIFQDALNAAESEGRDLVANKRKYKIASGVIQNNAVNVDLRCSEIDCSEVVGRAWTITSGKEIRHKTTPLRNVWLRGAQELTADVYNGNLKGLTIEAPQLQVSNILVTGASEAYSFGNNAYVVDLLGCAAWYSRVGWEAWQPGKSNMGAGLAAYNCLFAHNEYDLVNNLCESQFFNCAFDQVGSGFVQENITSAGGATNSKLSFNNCRFEASRKNTATLFKNSGLMLMNEPIFFEPLQFTNFFDNSGEVIIVNGFTRIQSELYNSVGNGTISIQGLRPLNIEGPGWKFSKKESGVFNGDLSKGTTDGFDVVTGNSGDLVLAPENPHSGSYSLRFTGRGDGTNKLVSWAIPVNPYSKNFLLSVYMKNISGTEACYPTIRVYNSTGVEVGSTYEICSANTLLWTMKRFYLSLPVTAAYVKFELELGSAFNGSNVYMDDFYVNQW